MLIMLLPFSSFPSFSLSFFYFLFGLLIVVCFVFNVCFASACMVKALSSLTLFFCVFLIPIVSILSSSPAKVVLAMFFSFCVVGKL